MRANPLGVSILAATFGTMKHLNLTENLTRRIAIIPQNGIIFHLTFDICQFPLFAIGFVRSAIERQRLRLARGLVRLGVVGDKSPF